MSSSLMSSDSGGSGKTERERRRRDRPVYNASKARSSKQSSAEIENNNNIITPVGDDIVEDTPSRMNGHLPSDSSKANCSSDPCSTAESSFSAVEPNDAQQEELAAIQAIYDEDSLIVSVAESGLSTVEFSVVCRADDDELRVVLDIVLPADYPQRQPPAINISGPSLTRRQKSRLVNSFDEIYAGNCGSPVLYEWFECARQFVDAVASGAADDEPSGSGRSSPAAADEGEDDGLEAEADLPDAETPSIAIAQGSPLTDRKSTFQAHVAAVDTVKQAEAVLRQLKRNNKVARATHNIYAYRIFEEDAAGKRILKQDCEDDGEHMAGGKLAHLLEMMQAENVIIVVSRWYGGIHLGPDRFKHINSSAHEILLREGFDKRATNAQPAKKDGKLSKNQKKKR